MNIGGVYPHFPILNLKSESGQVVVLRSGSPGCGAIIQQYLADELFLSSRKCPNECDISMELLRSQEGT